ncbi:MAG: type II toxin-antitoxin system RelE/ParE family toxin [Firmicutes bacterium]|nr:type II toxin-antitoxin system RelE/ParE family toxin [Bacillota bacterium]
MRCKIEYLSSFYIDVIEAADYLEEYPNKASRIFEKLDKLILDLAFMPRMYPMYEDYPDFRKIVIEDYMVFYKFDELTNTVVIHRFLCSRMDFGKLLT